MISFLLFIAFAISVSLAVSGFMIHAGVGDIPDDRSNHSHVTPTAGGVGIVAGLAGFFIMLPMLWPQTAIPPDLSRLLAILALVALLGLLDDIYTLHSGHKFVLLLGLAVLAVLIVGPVTQLPYALAAVSLPYWLGFLGSVLWIFVVTNAVNFMDGSNGLMPGVMLIACAALSVIMIELGAVYVAILPAALAAAIAGFIPYNLRNSALIFSGDVGSLTVGFGFAVSCLWMCSAVPQTTAVLIGPLLILPFLADVLLTMLRRARYRENLMSPHRTHIYQRLISAGWSHLSVANLYMIAGVILAAYAMYMVEVGLYRLTAFLLFPVIIFSLIYYTLSKRLKRKGY